MRFPSTAAVQRSTAIFRSKFFWVLFAAAVLGISNSPSASAGMEVNSRLNYGNAAAYCNNGYAKGMVWLSNNESDYYSEAVSVGTNATSVSVSIRGAVNSCRTIWDDRQYRDMWATDVSTSYLSGLSGNQFYRGTVSGSKTYEWSTQGSKLYGNLNIANVALCGETSLISGYAEQDVLVVIYRRQVQRQGQVTRYVSKDIGDEKVIVKVRRTCPTYNYSLYPKLSFTDGSRTKTMSEGQTVDVEAYVANTGPTQTPETPDHIPYTIYSYFVPANTGKVNVNSGIFNRNVTVNAGGINAYIQYAQTKFGTLNQDGCNWLEATFSGSGAKCTVTQYNSDVTPIRFKEANRNRPDNFVTGVKIPLNGYNVGDQICYFMAVRRFETAFNFGNRDDPTRRVSQPTCVIIGKAPKVQVLGGDLITGRAIAGMPTPVKARIVTSRTANTNGTFGSWVEYGAIATGSITGFASGSGLAGGAGINPNLLTFANQGNTSSSCETSLGCYAPGSTVPDVASRFRVSTTSPNMPSGSLTDRASGVYRGVGTINIMASTISAGRSIIINAPNSDVRILGNIEYANGPFTSAAQLPQVVIIARSITVREDVTRVDAWLVAPGAAQPDGTVSGGVIRTCDAAAATIDSGVCNKVLTINGPVIAHRLILLRTGGAGSGNAAGDPAEIFNFRPDAYMWALQQAQSSGRITTVSTKELPPRY